MTNKLTDERRLALWKEANGTRPGWGVFGRMVIDYAVAIEREVLASTQQPSGDPSLKNPMVRFPTEEDIREWEEARKRQPSGEVTDEAITWDRVVSIGSKHGMRWTEEAGWSFASDDPLHEFANDVARFYAARAQGGEQK
ncbi:hypothetical protein WJ91_12585 [Burkholderia ubonensis]|uniref:hypothetical protein n=1 Tax=Burkholderia ubonensis TaxID=101571 RepID=UPI000758EF20|nr:hypothetical protein [Burkholderia ubonensis]KVP59307.1 hypothetical protein WJ91_12585 [Burkholderia ubonensis]